MNMALGAAISSLPLIPISDGRFINVDLVMSHFNRLGYVPYIYEGETLEFQSEDVVVKFEANSFDHKICLKLVGQERLKHETEIQKERKTKEEKEEIVRAECEKAAALDARKRIAAECEETLAAPSGAARMVEAEVLTPGGIIAAIAKVGIPEDEKKDEANLESQEALGLESPLQMRLLNEIKKEFRIIRERGDYKLSENYLKNIEIFDREKSAAVIFNPQLEMLSINTLDPLVGKIMAALDTKPHLLYYLLSIIYSTINRELKEITDKDEMKFQLIMLENLLEHPSLVS
jgi:hypothetical protein